MSTRTSRATKRWTIAAAAAIACGSTLAFSGSANAALTAPTPERISGANRYETAVAVSKQMAPTCDFVIASGEDFPDGLASAVYSKPILLTQAATIPAATKAELDRLVGTTAAPGPCVNGTLGTTGVTTTVVGGPAVISSPQLEVLNAYGSATRVSGANRYATAIAVAKNRFPAGTTTAIIATGTNFPDALAGGVLAQTANGGAGAPILLNNGDSVLPDVAKYLFDSDPTTAGVQPVTTVYILGGTAAVPASVEAELKGALGITTVTRLAGSNRAATAVEITKAINPTVGAPPGNAVVVVNGSGFADALAAGPYAYAPAAGTLTPAVAGPAPILLTNATSIPAATASYHAIFCDPIDRIQAIGGTSVISNEVVAGAVGAATCSAPDITSATLLNNDFKQAVFSLPTTGGLLTVSAKPGTAADGAAANAWQVALVQNGTPGTEKVVVDPEGNDNAAYGGIPTFIMTANFPLLTNQGFVNVWNASPAAALTTAATTDGPAPVSLPSSASPGTVVPLLGLATTVGSQDSTVVVTFSRPVTNAVPSGLFGNLNPSSPPLNMGAYLQSPAVIPTPTGVTTVTYFWDNVSTAQPSLPSSQIRYAAGSITDAASNTVSALAAAKTLTAP